MGTWLWAIFLLNGQKAGSCGWMFRRVPVTGLRGQIFGCFLDYNNWTSAGEGVGAHVHSPCTYVGCAIIPGGFHVSMPSPASCLGLALPRGSPGCARAPCACCCAGLRGLFTAGKMLRAAGPAGAGSAFPLLAPGGFALAPRSLSKKTPTGERFELNLLPCSGSVPAQPQMDWGCGPAVHKSGRENVANTIQIFA